MRKSLSILSILCLLLVLLGGIVLLPLSRLLAASQTPLQIVEPTATEPDYAGPYDAPHKIVIRTTKPEDGLKEGDFMVQVGSQPVTVTTLLETDDRYVLEVIPSTQITNSLYDLSVAVGGVSSITAQAVRYAEANNPDVMLVLDRSGSMSDEDLWAAKVAAWQFVDQMQDMDKVGVVSFDHESKIDFPLTTIYSGTLTTLFADDAETDSGKWTAEAPWIRWAGVGHGFSWAWQVAPLLDQSVDAYLTSEPFSLTNTTNPLLNFWANWDASGEWSLEGSADGGNTWTTLFSEPVPVSTGIFYVERYVSLAPFAGLGSVQIRFNVDGYYTFGQHFRIDDVRVVDGLPTQKGANNAIWYIANRGGSTTIGGGLRDGQNQLSAYGDPVHPHAIVLLTDGLENTAPYVNEVLPDVVNAGTVVYSVGLGNVDQAQLQDIAAQTDGAFYYAPTRDELATIYGEIATILSGEQLLFGGQGWLAATQTVTRVVPLDPAVSEVTFSTSWAAQNVTLTLALKEPSGRLITPTIAAADPDITYSAGSGYAYYEVLDPVGGQWQMIITQEQPPVTPSPMEAALVYYTAYASGQSNLTLNVYTSQQGYDFGDELQLLVTLGDLEPISGAMVTATVTAPAPLSLIDMVLSESATPGVYTGILSGTDVITGTYGFDVYASGESNGDAVPFTRAVKAYVRVGYHPSWVYLPIVMRP